MADPDLVFEEFPPNRCRFFLVPGNGTLQGLDVACRDDGTVAFQPVDDRIVGFSLTPSAAKVLRDLLVYSLGCSPARGDHPGYFDAESFAIVVPTEAPDAE